MPDDDKTRLPEDSNSSNLLTPGQAFGQYQVIRLLGRGGMGEVYEVAHAVLHRHYALKVIRRDLLQQPSALERFKREAQVMNRLEHKHILQVDDFGDTEGLTWLRMPLVEGFRSEDGTVVTSLSDLMPRQDQDTVAPALVQRYLEEVLAALSYAHGKGAVHRDIKPSNVLIGREGHALIADFGLVSVAGEEWLQSQVQLTVARSQADPDATRLAGDASGSGGTSTQALMGTFDYMSPEQKRGQPADARSDLYAVGLMAFRMLTGQDAPGFELPSEIVPGLDPEWDVWFKSALAQQAGRRFESAAAMASSMPGANSDAAETTGAQWEEDIPGPEIAPGADEAIESADREESEPAHAEVEPPEDLQTYHAQDSEVEATGKEADIAHDEATSKRSFPLAWLIIVLIPILGLAAYFFSSNGGPVEKPEAVSRVVSQVDSVQQPEVDSSADKAIKVTGPEAGRDYAFDLGGGEQMELVWIAALNGWVGKYEVTNGQYRRYKSSHNSGDYKGHSLNGADQPVVQVSFNDAEAYAKWLNGKFSAELPSGYRFGLPDGKQWLSYAQCGDGRKYPWGNSMPPKYGNYSDLTAREKIDFTGIDGYRDGHAVTAPVSSSGRNDWGLYGVGGNVWEWTTETSGSSRVLRGASWYFSSVSFLRCERRLSNSPTYRSNDLGFRVVLLR